MKKKKYVKLKVPKYKAKKLKIKGHLRKLPNSRKKIRIKPMLRKRRRKY